MNQSGARTSSVVLAGFVALAGFASASETKRIGGNGGERTVTMNCGANSFIVGASAKGGKDTLIAPNLLRSVQFKCRPFEGNEPGDSTSKTTTARGTAPATFEISEKFADCPTNMVVTSLDLYSGWYIDRLAGLRCEDDGLDSQIVTINVGGSAGSRGGANCPAGEGLYRVDARVGSTIDSLKGYCRKFGAGLEDKWAHTQMTASIRPKVSYEAPVKIAPGQTKSFSFNVPESGKRDPYLILVSGQTDLLGGGVVNQPDYRVELLNPSGNSVKTETLTGDTMRNIPMTFGAAGGWKIRVTNRKKDYGALDLTILSISPDGNTSRQRW